MKIIEEYNGQKYEKIFDNSDQLSFCEKYCCFCIIGENGMPECNAPHTKDFKFDGCADGKFHWKKVN